MTETFMALSYQGNSQRTTMGLRNVVLQTSACWNSQRITGARSKKHWNTIGAPTGRGAGLVLGTDTLDGDGGDMLLGEGGAALDGDGFGETAGDDGATLGDAGAGEDATDDSGDATEERGALDAKLDGAGDDSAEENALVPKLPALVGPDGELDVKLLPTLDVAKLEMPGDGLGPGLNALDRSEESELGRLLGDAIDAKLDATACEDASEDEAAADDDKTDDCRDETDVPRDEMVGCWDDA